MTRDPWTEINALKPRGRGFGAAYRRQNRSEPIPIITERPIRPKFGGLSGRCPVCGSRYFGCGHDPEDAA